MYVPVYVNSRLPEDKRISSANFTTYVTNSCRWDRRDRDGEKKRRLEKLASGIPIKKRKSNKENIVPLPTLTPRSSELEGLSNTLPDQQLVLLQPMMPPEVQDESTTRILPFSKY